MKFIPTSEISFNNGQMTLLEGKSQLLEEFVKVSDPVLQKLLIADDEIDDNTLTFLEY